MEVYLIRHTETDCEKGICYGQSNVGLVENHFAEFEIIKNLIPTNAIVYSSPLLRCTLLANFISKDNYIIDNRLMEMNFGDWEMKKWDDINLSEINSWMIDFVNVCVPNGESFLDLYKRVNDFVENELKENFKNPIVIVTHAGVIRSFLCKISNLPLKNAFQNKVDFGQVIKVEL